MQNLTSPAADLERFRQALERRRSQLLEASRSSRYRPPTDLATAQVSLPGEGAGSTPILAEILDLSGDGLRVAISPGPNLRVGQICLLRFEPESGDGFHLTGEVRWVEASAHIVVFGIRLLVLEADTTPQVD